MLGKRNLEGLPRNLVLIPVHKGWNKEYLDNYFKETNYDVLIGLDEDDNKQYYYTANLLCRAWTPFDNIYLLCSGSCVLIGLIAMKIGMKATRTGRTVNTLTFLNLDEEGLKGLFAP